MFKRRSIRARTLLAFVELNLLTITVHLIRTSINSYTALSQIKTIIILYIVVQVTPLRGKITDLELLPVFAKPRAKIENIHNMA